MRRRIRSDKIMFFLFLYTAFTLICSLSCMLLQQEVLYELWYLVTLTIWIFFAVMSLMLIIQLLKIKNIRNNLTNRKE